jgi:TonB family protein
MRNEKILVVEFEENSLNSLLQLLQTEGFEVVTAKDGHEGLLKFESENPDLVILEPMLLKLHGFDLCRKISKDSPKKIPVIITTGFYKGEHYKSEAIETFGAAAFFEKPYKGEELITTIHDLLGNGTGEAVRGVDESIQETDVEVKDVDESIQETDERSKESEVIQAEAEQKNATIEKTTTGAEVSNEVDKMLKDALSEFGLSLDKKEPRVQKVKEKPERERPEEDLIGKKIENLRVESFEEREEEREDQEEEEVEELKTEDFIEELIRKEEQIEEEERLEEEGALAKEQDVSEEEVKEEIKEEVREELREEVLEEDPDSNQQIFEDYFEPPEKKPPHFTLLRYFKKIKKSIPLMIGSTAFVILVAAGATYYFLKPNKVSSSLQQEKQQIVSSMQGGISNSQEGSISRAPGDQDEGRQGATTSGRIEGDNRESLTSNQATLGSEAGPESIAEVAAPTRLSSRQRQVLLPPASAAPESREFEVIEIEDNKDSRVELSELSVSAPQLEETAKKIIQPENAENRIKTGDLVPIESVDVLPVAVSKVNPKYPNSAFQRGIEATVEFRALISEFGNVLDIVFVNPGGSASLFHTACEEAVRQWKFSPAKKDDVNVKVWKTFSISFKKKNTE